VFVLHDVEGLEHAEIAQALDVAVGTSKSQLHKARMHLRRLLSRSPLAGRSPYGGHS
jgi:RNA polymerase sigma-70 factor (ECF subfamily)